MANEIKTVPTGKRKPRRWLRVLGFFLLCMVVGLFMLYFLGTSEWALKSIILPRVSKAMNADITIQSASVSPFSSVDLRGLKVETAGAVAEKNGSAGAVPLVTAEKVILRYSLTDIIKGNINVSEITLDSPVVTLITFPDGTSNLDPITKGKKQDSAKEEKPETKSEKPPQLNLGKLALNNATVRKIEQRKDGTRQVMELTGVNIAASNLGNSRTGKLALAADMRFDQGLNSASNGVLATKVNGNFDVTLDDQLKPTMAKGQTKLDVAEARGAFQQAAGLGVVLNTDVTPTQLNDVSVRFEQGGKGLGALTATGPFNAETMEGKLAVTLSQIDRQLLNLAGAAMGMDFNQTSISSTNTIELTQKGRMLAIDGGLVVASFSVTQKGQTSPPLDVRSGYAFTYDQTNKTAVIQTFTLNGSQNNAEFLRGTLARPMTLDLGKASGAVDESAFDLVITNFNLPDWQAFIGTNATISSGKLGVTLNIVSQQAGQKLALNLDSQIRQLTAIVGSNRVENADVTFSTRGTVTDFSAVNLDQYRAELARAGQQAFLASGALQYNTRSQDADVQANVDTSLPQVASLVSMPGMNISAGTLKFVGRIVQKNTTPQQTNNPVLDRGVTGKLNLDGLTGAFQSNRFDRFIAALDVDFNSRGDVAEIRKLSGVLRQSELPGGAFEVTGNYDSVKKTGLINAQLLDLNQNALKSFLAAALGDKRLESVVINSKTTAKLDGPTDMAVKTEVHVANLVIDDPSGQVPKTPLAVDLNADIAQVKGVLDLKSVVLALTKTERAPNSLNVAGRIDMSKSNAWTGNLKVMSEGLDVTPYYEIFAGKTGTTNATAKGSSKPEPTPTETKPETEPAPMTLPFTQFVADVSIAKFFLREIAISNLMAKAVIDHGRVTVNPFSLTLNGGAVNFSALMNLAMAGYEYDVNANLGDVPIEPLANTFMPEKKGQYKGTLQTSARIKGAGITGPSLQKNLGGQLGLTLTNANIQVLDNPRLQKILRPIAVAIRVPELANSPLSWVNAQTIISNGTINIPVATAESSVFRAGLSGTITMASVMSNSVLNRLPVDLALSRTVAERARMAPADLATNVQFVALPRFVSVGGTVGEPKPQIDSVAVGRILAGTVGNFVGGDAGKILRGLGNLGAGSSTNTSSTNVTSTNAVGNLIQGLGGLLQRQSKTNVPTTNAPARNNRFKLNDILK